MCIIAAFVRSAAYSVAETRTPMVSLWRNAGSPLGRPPVDLRLSLSVGMRWLQAVLSWLVTSGAR
jgi:hypothetical protein